MARKRQRARELGLCIKCCKTSAQPGRVACTGCKAATTAQKRRHRKKIQEATLRRQVAAAHEVAGDGARENGLLEGAAKHYRNALSFADADPVLDARISKKLAQILVANVSGSEIGIPTLILSGPWGDNLEYCEDAIGKILQTVRHSWLAMGRQSTIPLLEDAVRIARGSPSPGLLRLTKAHLMDVQATLGNVNAASLFLEELLVPDSSDGTPLRVSLHHTRAVLALASGKFEDAAYALGEAAKGCAELTHSSHADLYNVCEAWMDRASVEWCAGNPDAAKRCYRQAILESRRFQVNWYRAFITLQYASMLTDLGDDRAAHAYVLNALSIPNPTPVLQTAIADVGIRTSLAMNDRASLAKCAQPQALDFAFRSGQPNWISAMSIAFAQLCAAEGRPHEAEELLGRALTAVGDRLLCGWVETAI